MVEKKCTSGVHAQFFKLLNVQVSERRLHFHCVTQYTARGQKAQQKRAAAESAKLKPINHIRAINRPRHLNCRPAKRIVFGSMMAWPHHGPWCSEAL